MLRGAIAFLGLALLFSTTAVADKRVALVIGNSAYKHTSELINPKNDAADMAAALRRLGFQVVDGLDLDKGTMETKLREFARALAGSDVGLMFYAGHGLQVGGVNYLVPVDAKLDDASGIDFELVRLDLVQRTMERETSRTNILFLDACRDNPLARNLARAMGTRSATIGRGLAQVEAGGGTLISYSTQPGNVASDGAGRNSPFAGALVRHIVVPGVDLANLLVKVRRDVMQETQNRQVPWEHSALTDAFYFNSGPDQRSTRAPGAAPTWRLSDAAEAWDRTKDTTNIAVLELFIASYKDTFYAGLARLRIDELKKQQVSVATPPPAAKPTPAPQAKPAVSTTPQAPKATGRCDGIELVVGASERRCIKPGGGQIFKDCDICPEMVVVPAGHFQMGSPPRTVTVAKPFAVGRFAVTRAEFAAFAKDSEHKGDGCYVLLGAEIKLQPAASWRAPGFSQDDRHPVVCPNWNDAKAFTTWLSREAGTPYRLLSEAEREYVTRAGTSTTFWWGPSASTTGANFKGTGAAEEFRRGTVPVDSFARNAWGLYNVHGNVWEWIEDCWHDNYQGAPTDTSAWVGGDCTRRVQRGGSWWEPWTSLGAGARGRTNPTVRSSTNGFRVAKTLHLP